MAELLENLLIGSSHETAWNPDGSLRLTLKNLPAETGRPHDVMRLSPGVRKIAQTLLVVRGSAPWVLIELQYFDSDYRSEFSATHEIAFAQRRSNCSRLHFFGDVEIRKHKARRRPLTEVLTKLAIAYVGYIVVRPQVPGTLGRTMLSPIIASSCPTDLAGAAVASRRKTWLPSGDQLRKRIRTSVTDSVEVLGVPMTVTGVPFMEQDGYLLTCAHVSAWIAHYSAVLRGVVSRRPTAEFNRVGSSASTFGRGYPSHGLELSAVSETLRRLDLPCEVLDTSALLSWRKVTWHDRKELAEAINGVNPNESRDVELEASDGERYEAFAKIRAAEALTATVCRYLNSGIPVILCEEETSHTRVICGYIREEDTLLGVADQPHDDLVNLLPGGGAGAFIYQDDQEVPYTVESVADIVDRAGGDVATHPALVVPLPFGLWMSGATAERLAAEIFEKTIRDFHRKFLQRKKLERGPNFRIGFGSSFLARGFASHRSDLHYQGHVGELFDAVQNDSRKFALRTYAITGSEYKTALRARAQHLPVLVEAAAYVHLPKYVWVVELILREKRKEGTDPNIVVGTLLLDPSVVDEGDQVERLASPLLLHVGGEVTTFRGLPNEVEWSRTGLSPYRSGRWGQNNRLDGNRRRD